MYSDLRQHVFILILIAITYNYLNFLVGICGKKSIYMRVAINCA